MARRRARNENPKTSAPPIVASLMSASVSNLLLVDLAFEHHAGNCRNLFVHPDAGVLVHCGGQVPHEQGSNPRAARAAADGRLRGGIALDVIEFGHSLDKVFG